MKGELQNVKSTLRENSVELERAKNLLSEREVVVRNLEEKLAGCQSELEARERKLNDVEASLKSEIERYKKINFSIKKKIEILMREKGDVIKENKDLLKLIEDLKSSQKTTSETANVQAINEKDFRIQTLEKTLEKERDNKNRIQTLEKTLEKERDENKKEKASRRKAESVFFSAIQNLSKDKKQIEESIEKHRQAVKEVIEHYSGQSSQIPSGSAVEEHFRSYFLAAKRMEESPCPFQDGSTSQTPLTETLAVDAAPAGRQVATPPRPVQVKATEERVASTFPKPSTEQRKGRRVLVRPILGRVEEPQADADTPIVEGSTVQEKGGMSTERGSTVSQEKGGPSLERETSGGASVLPSSGRKRLILSSQVRDDASQGEANDDNPPSKKHKEDFAQDSSELKNDQPAPEDVTTHAPVVLSMDIQDGQQPVEEMDADQASMPIEEVEDARDDEVGNNDDMEEHTGASMDIEGQDSEVNIDSDATAVEDVPVKSEPVVESFDDDQKLEDVNEEGQITTATDVEDEREEGELPEESEQHSDSTTLETGEQAGDAFKAASPGVPTAKGDTDMSEEIGEGDGTSERVAAEPDQSPLAQSGGADASPSRTADVSPAREPSPSNPAQAGGSSEQQNPGAQAGASSEQQNPGAAAESGGRTINLQERAMQNRRDRQARLQRPTTSQPTRPPVRQELARGQRARTRRGGQPK